VRTWDRSLPLATACRLRPSQQAVTTHSIMSAPSPYSQLSSEVQQQLTDLQADDTHYEPQNAHELFKLQDAVQIFFLSATGHVSTFSAPDTLRIFQFCESGTEEAANVFLQVGGWTQPLVPGTSPALLAENGAIMFPDIYSDQPGGSVGLVLLESVGEQKRGHLLDLLAKHAALQQKPQAGPQLGALGSGIVKGAELLSKGIEIGAGKAGELIEYVTEKSQEKIARAEEDVKIGSLTKSSVNAAKTASTATVKVSGYVAGRVGKLTKSLAGYLASKAEKPLSGTVVNPDKKQGRAMSQVIDAARGGLIAYGTVYNGLESSAKVLGTHVKENSVKIVCHKYGGEAGTVFGEAASAAGNAAMTYMNVQSLGVKGLVKKTAKETGKTVVKNAITGNRKSVMEEAQK